MHRLRRILQSTEDACCVNYDVGVSTTRTGLSETDALLAVATGLTEATESGAYTSYIQQHATTYSAWNMNDVTTGTLVVTSPGASLSTEEEATKALSQAAVGGVVAAGVVFLVVSVGCVYGCIYYAREHKKKQPGASKSLIIALLMLMCLLSRQGGAGPVHPSWQSR